jgi:DeoR/GlpR family transcriptional regulator of sugar metabolism
VPQKSHSAAQRRQLIMEKLRDGDGVIHVEELSLGFGVSVATVRRDLDRLDRDGLITRTYGGAVFGNVRAEQSLREREVSSAAAKDAIARAAASLVDPGSTVFLDAGTTTGRLSYYLARIPGLTVLTNGLNALNVFAESDTDVQAIALGGILRRTNQAMTGSIAETVVRSVYADVAFLGTDCVDAARGISSRTLEQNNLKRLMSGQARRTVVLADSSKLNSNWGTYWTAFPVPIDLVTDDGAGDKDLLPFRQTGTISLTIADVQSPDSRGTLAG